MASSHNHPSRPKSRPPVTAANHPSTRKPRVPGTPATAYTSLRIAVDSGGTFTDCVWLEKSALHVLKVFSTPADPSQAIVEAVERIAPAGQSVIVLHGTTVGTNTLLQRKGAKVAFVTTAGFEDSIEIGRQNRPRLYDFFFEKDLPLAAAEMRFGIEERTSVEGEVLRAPDKDALHELSTRVAQSGAQAIAVSLLFSFANPANEQAVAGELGRLGLPISVSHVILPEFREYERASTVLVNAYLQPVMENYLRRLQQRISGESTRVNPSKPQPGLPGTATASRIFVMQSSGGITALTTAASEPVRTVLSGPAGGVVGAAAVAGRSGSERIITFDMGGTSTDVALIDGRPTTTNEADIAGLPIRVPVLDIHTVGAGGGSLARFDAGGALRVGPESAGADPGPICYGKGDRPTVTDANLLLGRLPADQFLGGDFILDLGRTRSLTQRWLRENGSRLSLEEFAAGVVRVVNANMERAIRVVSIERGHDPRRFALVAFGGAGAMHACELAASLRIPQVIVPACPGALSALGILISDVVKDNSRTVLLRTRVAGPAGSTRGFPRRQLDEILAKLRQDVATELKKEGWQGRAVYEASADLRYRGQGYEINLGYGDDLLARFHLEHKRRYGYSSPEQEIEIVTVRMRARVASPEKLSRMRLQQEAGNLKATTTKVRFDGKTTPAQVLPRSTLTPGRRYRGPAIITEYSATSVIPPGFNFQVDKAGNLLVGIGRK